MSKDNLNNEIKSHSAAASVAGYDYQFYYFIFYLLNINAGECIGWEVEDDVHINLPDGKLVLVQSKHSTDEASSLTDSDFDLWKTISNWVSCIPSTHIKETYLRNTDFILVTNKQIKAGSIAFKINNVIENEDISLLQAKFKSLKDSSDSENLKKYINNLLSLENLISLFLSKIKFEINYNIIEKIKERIKVKFYVHDDNLHLIDDSLSSVYGSLAEERYQYASSKRDFIICEEYFRNQYGSCFANLHKPKTFTLDTNFTTSQNDSPINFTFIRQLVDIKVAKIEEADKVNKLMLKYYLYKNNIEKWQKNALLLEEELVEIEDEGITKWENEFESEYQQQEESDLDHVENESNIIKTAKRVYFNTMKLDIRFFGVIDRRFSNGFYLFQSNKDNPVVGWHLNFKSIYHE